MSKFGDNRREFSVAGMHCVVSVRTALLTLMLGSSFVAGPFVEGATDSKWDLSHSSYRFSTREDVGEYMPEDGSPMRAVYDVMAAIVDRDAESLVGLFTDESRQDLLEFARLWAPRLQDRTLEMRRQGIRDDDGIAYVGIIGLLGGPGATDNETFADVIFLKLTDGEWRLTHKVLDAAECDRVIDALDMLRVRRVNEIDAFRRRIRDQREESDRRAHERAYRIGKEMLGKEVDEEEMKRDYKLQKARTAYRKQREDEGTWPRSFREVLDIYDGEVLDHPISFDITEEPSNPNFNSLLDAIRTAFYLGTLQPKATRGEHLPELLDWQNRSLEEVDVEGDRPEYLPKLFDDLRVRLGGLGMIQIMCRIPVTYSGNDYQVILYNMIQVPSTSAYRLPIAMNGQEFIGSGYTYFKKDNGRWIPNQDLGGYLGLNGVLDIFHNFDGFYSRRHSVRAHRIEDAVELLGEMGDWPATLRKLYSVDECLDIDEARRQGIWSDL